VNFYSEIKFKSVLYTDIQKYASEDFFHFLSQDSEELWKMRF